MYYWKRSYDEVGKFVSECEQCQRKETIKKARKPLNPIPVTSAAFKQIGVDLVGPLGKNENGVSSIPLYFVIILVLVKQ